MLQQAREDGKLDGRGKRIGPPLVSLADPRPASGVSAMLWDAMMAHRQRDAERAAAGLPPAADPWGEAHARCPRELSASDQPPRRADRRGAPPYPCPREPGTLLPVPPLCAGT